MKSITHFTLDYFTILYVLFSPVHPLVKDNDIENIGSIIKEIG